MPEDNKKKKAPQTPSQQMGAAAEQQAVTTEQAGAELDNALQQAGQQQEEQIAAANVQHAQKLNAAQQAYQDRVNAGYTDFVDILGERKAQTQQAQQEAQQQVEADRKAAKWTGLTELATSLVNLYGVGEMNAAPQQYKPVSQDWMKKADEDLKAGRSRVENLLERERAAKAQLNQLKISDARQAFELAKQQADADLQQQLAKIKRRHDTEVASAKIKADTASNAAGVRAKGEQNEAQMRFNQQKETNDVAQANRAREDRLAMYGMTLKDGKPVVDTESEIYKAYSQRRSGGSGSENQIYYYDADGNFVWAPMKNKEYEAFLDKVYALAMNDPEFSESYAEASNERERKSMLFNYASNNPDLRAELDARRGEGNNIVRRATAKGDILQRTADGLRRKVSEAAAGDSTEDKYKEFE